MRREMAKILPVTLAVGVFGVAYGALASVSHIPAWHAVLASMVVFAGSAQFASLAVIAAGGSYLAAIAAGVLLNTRFLATGAAVGPVLPGGRLRRFLAAQLVVDESYALAVAMGEGHPTGRVLVLAGATEWIFWVGGTALGALFGPIVGDPNRLGFDAAFPACFVALLWPLVRGHSRAVRSAVAGAAVALALAPFTPAGIPLLGAALAGLALGG